MNKHEYERKMKARPHLVLLGAGASIAAIPNGDKHGRKTSVMNGFIDKLGMRELINDVELETDSDNLEDIYSEIHQKPEYSEALKELDDRIFSYFSEFEIPDEPTVYDCLVLSLRKKDAIATFNWDPLLVQAYMRCRTLTEDVPELLFLHGNVSVGVCNEHKRGGPINSRCSVCGKSFERIPLLYPVKEKDYDSHLLIRDSWNSVRQYMERAYMLTVFGYSAPKTDKSAIELLKSAWGSISDRNYEEIEIVDIREKEDVKKSWDDFIHSHHYSVHKSFYDTTLGKFPRRSTEALFDKSMNNMWLDDSKGLRDDMNFSQLGKYFVPIIKEELQNY
ncbi:hypothetical protein EXN50_00445 [Clostridium botulinum]|nr:hypothetical protein [Clostridium botulinum]NFF10926.1 hypothetical protein [Clostridium botulinum]